MKEYFKITLSRPYLRFVERRRYGSFLKYFTKNMRGSSKIVI